MGLLISCMSGASASMRKEKVTLPHFVKEVVDGMSPKIDYNLNAYNSIGGSGVRKTLKTLEVTDGNVLFIGKSLGGVQTWWMMKEHMKEIEYFLANGHKVGVILIDPHGAKAGDGKFGSYGTFLRKTMNYDKRWNRGDIKVHCLYQRDKYPKGAKLSLKMCNTKMENADHWQCTQLDTKAGKEVAENIGWMVQWLTMKYF